MGDSGDHQASLEEKTLDSQEHNDAFDAKVSIVGERGDVVNASGHRDQLQRHYGLLSICGLALTIDNAWVALGGSIAVSICELLFRPAQEKVSILMELQSMVDRLAFYMSS